jgi:hypothetical protein
LTAASALKARGHYAVAGGLGIHFNRFAIEMNGAPAGIQKIP